MAADECFESRECKFDSDDLDCLNRLERESYRYYAYTEPDKPRQVKHLDNSYVMLVDDKQTKQKGVATCSASWKMMWAGGKMRLCGEIYRLRVDSTYRRRGLGRFLTSKMEQVLVEKGVELIYCVIWTPNPASESLFEKVVKVEKVYKTPMRMMSVEKLAKEVLSDNERALKVECALQPVASLAKLFSTCLLWSEDPKAMQLSLYQVDLPDGKGAVKALLWHHVYPLGLNLMPTTEHVSVFFGRLLNRVVPSLVEKPIGQHEKFVVRFVYPILIPENLQPAEVARAVKAIFHTIAVESHKTGINYLVVPTHPQVSQLNATMLNSGIIPFNNLLPDMEHCLYVKILPSTKRTPDELEEFKKSLARDTKGSIFINAAEL